MDEEQQQIWLFGAIDITIKVIRLDIVSERNIIVIKSFVKNHIEPGINIIHDGWSGDSFLHDDDSAWTNETHIHDAGDFGYILHSIIHIEQFWGQLKLMIKKIYYVFSKTGYIYFIREAEFR